MNNFNCLQLDFAENGVATLWLNRPEKNNAFNDVMIRELIIALEVVRENSQVRMLIVRGRGRHFSAGADLGWMRESAQLDLEANLDDAHELAELMYSLFQLPVPTLAVVQGAAFGGAVGLVSCCDMAIGAEDAQFSLSEVRIGLAPAVISPFVVRAMGERATRRYALTAERFSGQTARDLGLLAECYPASELEVEVENWITNLQLNSPQAMKVGKGLLLKVANGQLSPELREHTEQTIAHLRVSFEGQEGLSAFLEKRKPSWQEM